jgi:serine/threonine-protein kinase
VLVPDSNLPQEPPLTRVGGRYLIATEIGAGGMATVHLGCTLGAAGFRRTVAVKRLHPHLAREADFVAMFVDEARLAARIRHPNVVSSIDVASEDGHLFLVMEYVHGESLSKLLRALRARGEAVPLPIVSAVIAGALYGLHAAHEARDERGAALGLVHRDVSPQNIIVGADGVPRVFDFGVAKAAGRLQTTRGGQMKGKFAYMAPEQLADEPVDRRTDVYAASIVLWEMLANRQLFRGESDAAVYREASSARVSPPSSIAPQVPASLDEIAMRGLARSPADRYANAREMAHALEAAVPPANAASIGEWVEKVAAAALASRAQSIADLERTLARSGAESPDDPEADLPTTAYVEPRTQAYVRHERGQAADLALGPDTDAPTTGVGASAADTRSEALSGGRRARVRAGLSVVAAAVSVLTVVGAVFWLRGPESTAKTAPRGASDVPAADLATRGAPPAHPVSPPEVAAVGTASAPAAAADSRPAPAARARGPIRDDAHAVSPAVAPVPRATAVAAQTSSKLAASSAPPAPSASARNPCNPPWIQDNEGIRHPKPECF